jgi:phosphatidylglycerophosphate synthase
MLDRWVRRSLDPGLDRAGHFLAARGIRADWVTWTGFALGVGAAGAVAIGWHMTALVLLPLSRLLDGLDGSVARATSPTDRGAYLDVVLDFLFYALFVFAFALEAPEKGLAASFLILGFVGTGTTFLAHATFLAKRGVTPAPEDRKGLAYLGGLTEGTETIALFMFVCLFPDTFAWAAWGFGSLCWLTTIFRLRATLSELS